jgi:predicted helicase
MIFDSYIENVNKRYKSGITTEHSFRGDLQNLLEQLLPDVLITNEPTRISCGAPDYILTKKGIPLGYIEAKDLGADLNSKSYSEQFIRYRKALNNLIITNYLDFQFYKNGELVSSYSLGKIGGGKVNGNPKEYESVQERLKNFASDFGQTIKSPQKLAVMMANKAKMLALVINEALVSDEIKEDNSTLQQQLQAFKDILIHQITPKEFSDIYAQTIAYGMFAARLNDASLPTFTRGEAAELIPKSNPFLRKLFQYIAGYDLDSRIVWIVDELADIFRATDVAALLKNFGKDTQQTDPIIHFYETFLAEYDPKLRKARGVWYTPEPVVKFIVRAVDDILKIEFGLQEGLANTSKTKIKVRLQETDKRYKNNVKTIEEEVHRVQILDPATGTGTFLAEVIKQIHGRFEGQQGIWSNYVETHLLPRLNGFELLMASYAMAHLQLELLLGETGFKPTTNQRFRVFLTNSLEESHPDTGTLFANWLSTEANEANRVKRDAPVMVVMGNPPYSVSSSNKGEWIQQLVSDYKQDLDERNINPLSDDYIKFIRYAEYFVNKNGNGIVAMITNNSFIDGLIHRQMRKHLLETFNLIYILDLHGSTKKNEVYNGSKDENVFDIQQGVAVSIFVKSKSGKQGNRPLVNHFDLLGKREAKYNWLLSNSIHNTDWKQILPVKENYFFIQKSNVGEAVYQSFPSLKTIMPLYASGFKTERDSLTIQFDIEALNEIKDSFKKLSEEEIRKKYCLSKDGRDWKISFAKNDLTKNESEDITVLYRPFDFRHTIYTGKSKGFLAYPRTEIAENLVGKSNLSLLTCRQQSTFDFQHVLITNKIADMCSVSLQTKETTYQFPLYIYSNGKGNLFQKHSPVPNISPEYVAELSKVVKPKLDQDKNHKLSPENILDYIYAVLHSPTYRKKYKEFLKIDFPRVPYPKDADTFWQLVKLGSELREIHLLESPNVNKYNTKYPVDGSNTINKPKFENGKVYINETQYFEGVPESAWNLYVGGYQPAQKWLKDRKGRELSYEEIFHYQKIVKALDETGKLMQEIDQISDWD